MFLLKFLCLQVPRPEETGLTNTTSILKTVVEGQTKFESTFVQSIATEIILDRHIILLFSFSRFPVFKKKGGNLIMRHSQLRSLWIRLDWPSCAGLTDGGMTCRPSFKYRFHIQSLSSTVRLKRVHTLFVNECMLRIIYCTERLPCPGILTT